MNIVSSDRRVMSKEHLKPSLGPYAGKCVPKDSKELMNASKSEFLKAVYKVNEETKLRYQKLQEIEEPEQSPQKEPQVVVIIPTKCRQTQLERALSSVAAQSQQPNEIIVVGEEETDFPTDKKSIESKFAKTKVHWRLNSRTKNISGAINTASRFLISKEIEPSNTYLAILDDDDTWESDYCRQISNEQSRRKRSDYFWIDPP